MDTLPPSPSFNEPPDVARHGLQRRQCTAHREPSTSAPAPIPGLHQDQVRRTEQGPLVSSQEMLPTLAGVVDEASVLERQQRQPQKAHAATEAQSSSSSRPVCAPVGGSVDHYGSGRAPQMDERSMDTVASPYAPPPAQTAHVGPQPAPRSTSEENSRSQPSLEDASRRPYDRPAQQLNTVDERSMQTLTSAFAPPPTERSQPAYVRPFLAPRSTSDGSSSTRPPPPPLHPSSVGTAEYAPETTQTRTSFETVHTRPPPGQRSTSDGSSSVGSCSPPVRSRSPDVDNKLDWAHLRRVLTVNGTQLERLGLLGSGASGVVFVARSLSNSSDYFALKVVKRGTFDLFSQELSVMRELEHPHLVKLCGDMQDAWHIYGQIELCVHGSMQSVLSHRAPFTEPECRYYMVQLSAALAYLKLRLVLHCDIKPDNIVLDRGMKAKLADFGVAVQLSQDHTTAMNRVGTPGFMAPEVVAGENYGHEIDVYSLGVTLTRMLDGKFMVAKDGHSVGTRKACSLQALLDNLTNPEPSARPTPMAILHDPWICGAPFPRSIPPSAAKKVPAFTAITHPVSVQNFLDVRREATQGKLKDHTEDSQLRGGRGLRKKLKHVSSMTR